MLRMLIVEDERWEREGLVEFIDWSELGVEVIGAAKDGIDGLTQTIALRPDIVITDIQMPGMNGLEMSKRIREVLPETRIVVLTGYSEFSYAREALLLQADNYLLKPCDEEEMREVIGVVAEKCRKGRHKRREEEQQLFRTLLNGHGMATEQEWSALGHSRVNSLLAENAAFTVAIVCPPEGSGGDAELRTHLQDCLVMPCDALPQAYTVLLPLPEGEGHEPMSHLATLLTHWAELPSRRGGLIGLGEQVPELHLLPTAYQQALHTVSFGIFHERNGVLDHEAVAAAEREFSKASRDFLQAWHEHEKQIRSALLSLHPNQLEQEIGQLFDRIRSCTGADKAYVSSLLNSLLAEMSLLQVSPPAGEGTGMQQLAACSTISDMRDLVQSLLLGWMEQLSEKRGRKDDYIVDKVVQLIEEHYGSSEISLTMLAEQVFVSPNHLGVIFKKAKGKTIHQFLMDVRMRKAEDLLRSTKKKVSEVAAEVGMGNFSHFCLMFKQAYGMTPGNYQEWVKRG